MRLEAVFLSVRPIVESLARSTMPSSTTLFSNNRNVQRARPLGGLEHARAISLASFSPSKIAATGGVMRGLRLTTASIKPERDEMFDIDHLQKEAERYRSEARHAATDDRRKYLMSMAKLSETMASNDKMRAWLDNSIAELKSGAPLLTVCARLGGVPLYGDSSSTTSPYTGSLTPRPPPLKGVPECVERGDHVRARSRHRRHTVPFAHETI